MPVSSWSTTAASNAGILTGITLDGAVMNVPLVDDALRDMAAQIASQLGKIGFKGADIAAAATTNLALATGWYCDVTGSGVSITNFGTVAAGQMFVLRFTGTPTLVYHPSNLILPGSASITVAAGDVAMMMSLGSGAWRCLYSSAVGMSGTYTPVSSALSNVTSVTPSIARYMRIGNVVKVGGILSVAHSIASSTGQWNMTLPVASNLAVQADLTGVGTFGFNPIGASTIYAEATTNTAHFVYVCPTGTPNSLTYEYSYTVI